MDALLNNIRSCQICSPYLENGVRPVIQVASSAQLLIIGQAPGKKVHETGIPWNDASGKRLREWLNISEPDFYDPFKVAIMPMGFCYPGKGKSGDLPPRKECAPQWHEQVLQQLNNLKLILLIGQYAQSYYLNSYDPEFAAQHKTLTDRVKHTKELTNHIVCLPHPSPRNQIWLKKNTWFEQETLPFLQSKMRELSIS